MVIGKIKDTVEYWVKVYKKMADDHPELSEYVNKSVSEIGKVDVKEWVGVNILDIFYRILAHEPFNEWKEDVEKHIVLVCYPIYSKLMLPSLSWVSWFHVVS